jgi:glycosyltransferase involved in cell wall biosynthesis
MLNILIEGWRGINHSFSLVNQHQLIEMLDLPGISIYHEDMPYANPRWNGEKNRTGFPQEALEKIRSIPPIGNIKPDVTYRISWPYRFHSGQGRIFVFVTAESRVDADRVLDSTGRNTTIGENIKIITPSNWSKRGLLNFGFDESDISLVPCGISPDVFFQEPLAERQQARRSLKIPGDLHSSYDSNISLWQRAKRAIKISDESFMFLNVGAMTPNKGVDKLILAFSLVKRKFQNSILVLKDQNNLYGIRARDLISTAHKNHPELVTEKVINSIWVLSDNLDFAGLRALYNAADAYVSPYRSEGFNMCPLEAAACGVPIIVTKGGATDDYFHHSMGRQVEGELETFDNGLCFIEPNLESLVSEMEILASRTSTTIDPSVAIARIRSNYSWNVVTRKLVDHFVADS